MTAPVIYVLELQCAKFYVGRTTNLEARWAEHLKGQGSSWTRRYPVVRLVETRPLNKMFDEDVVTKEYMLKYGIENVRGGSFCTIWLSEPVERQLTTELRAATNACYRCGQVGHYANQCRQCARCGQAGCTDCPRLKCYRCGRQGHYATRCPLVEPECCSACNLF
jgi:cellular nucleic acid-binding protein